MLIGDNELKNTALSFLKTPILYKSNLSPKLDKTTPSGIDSISSLYNFKKFIYSFSNFSSK